MSQNQPELQKSFINNFSQAAFRGNAAWFLGAGVSKPSGLPSWATLLRPLAEPLGIHLQNEGEDLPAIAQYIINYHSGNRGPLIQAVRNALSPMAKPSAYHRAVARSGIGVVWTTNYDFLMEFALDGIPFVVRTRESDFVGWEIPKADVEVVKAHGCLKVSAPNEIVLASEDYEDYELRRPALLQRLRNDLLRRSFLFVGYGYGDPNIRTALVEARRLAGNATMSHYMLQTRVDATSDPERAGRQELWCTDLRRMGVNTLLTSNYDETQRIVEEMAVLSRGPTLYVTGSHTENDGFLAAQIGSSLAASKAKRPILLDGQSTGVSRHLLSAFQRACVEARVDVRDRMRFFPNPYAANPELSNEPKLMPLLKQWRASLLRQAHTVLVFDGGMGTQAEVEIARDLGCRIIPVPQKDGPVAELLADAAIIQTLNPGYVDKAKAYSLEFSDVVDCILRGFPSWT